MMPMKPCRLLKKTAENINEAIEQLTGGEGGGDLSQITQTLNQASQAAEKVSNYVTSFEQMSVKTVSPLLIKR